MRVCVCDMDVDAVRLRDTVDVLVTDLRHARRGNGAAGNWAPVTNGA